VTKKAPEIFPILNRIYMKGKRSGVLLAFALMVACAFGVEAAEKQKVDVVSFWAEQQYAAVAPGGKSAVAIHFEPEKGWHFYASADTAPGGTNLKFEPNEQGSHFLTFSKPIFPKTDWLYDEALDKKIEVIGGNFTVFLPFEVAADAASPKTVAVNIGIAGAVCSQTQCRVPDFGSVRTEVKISKDTAGQQPAFTVPKAQPPAKTTSGSVGQFASYSVWAALILAFVAGLSLNIMPCVWPVLPIIVMRLVEQAKQGRGKSFTLGLSFCLGMILFFACLAGANIVLRLAYGTTLQWGDPFRSPAILTALVLILVVLSLFMFGLFSISVPSSLAGKAGQGRGFSGAVGMGFLAAVLSTPCSFGILAGAVAWAQVQPLPLATSAILIIGVGMAAPYAILTTIPSLLKKAPKPGRWMELFKQAIGFVLLIIAVKFLSSLPGNYKMDVLYFAIVLAFCVWMWGGWVSFATPALRRWVIRAIAAALAVVAGFAFLKAPAPSLIAWQKYDAGTINKTLYEGKPVLIDFTADWCLSCQIVDRTVYSRKDIAELIKQKGVMAVKADTTLQDYPATIALKKIYDEPGVPVSILLVPGKEPVRWNGIAFGGELKKALEKLPGQ